MLLCRGERRQEAAGRMSGYRVLGGPRRAETACECGAGRGGRSQGVGRSRGRGKVMKDQGGGSDRHVAEWV